MADDPMRTPYALSGPALHDAKRAVRDRVLALRDALDPAERAAASVTIGRHIMALPSFAAARVVLLTLPFRSEWDTRALFRAARAAGKTVALPRVDGVARMLQLHDVGDESDTAPGHRGIPEPTADAPMIAVDAIDWVLVPGVAFDHTGRRLGYGGGFYDRLLASVAKHIARVAGAFDVQVVDRVPAAPHDLTVDLVITDRRVVTPAGA